MHEKEFNLHLHKLKYESKRSIGRRESNERMWWDAAFTMVIVGFVYIVWRLLI